MLTYDSSVCRGLNMKDGAHGFTFHGQVEQKTQASIHLNLVKCLRMCFVLLTCSNISHLDFRQRHDCPPKHHVFNDKERLVVTLAISMCQNSLISKSNIFIILFDEG